MANGHKSFTIADPRGFDGNPFEVAERTVGQLHGLSVLLREAIPDAAVMARNAEMERQLQRRETPSVEAWEESAEGRAYRALLNDTVALTKRLDALRKSAGYDPKHPPKA